MAYATVGEIRRWLAHRDLVLLTDLDGDTGDVVEWRIEDALDDASAEIDSYLGKAGLTLPLNPAPRILNVLCRDMALHRLHIGAGHTGESTRILHKAAIDFLESVKEGDMALGDSTGQPPEIVSPGVAMTDGPERQLTRDSLKGF